MAKEHILHSLFLIKIKIADESDEECIIVF